MFFVLFVNTKYSTNLLDDFQKIKNKDIDRGKRILRTTLHFIGYK